jgi:GNAT superfamily N-acetyltransferase
MQVSLREPRSAADFASYYDLRWRILREPWTQSKETARDEHEDAAVHFTAWVEETLAGVGRLHFNSPEEGQIRYMAVDPQFLRQGVGSAILRELEARARAAGATRVVLNAREAAVPFYRTHGYVLSGKSETLFGSIDHWSMSKELDPHAPSEPH